MHEVTEVTEEIVQILNPFIMAKMSIMLSTYETQMSSDKLVITCLDINIESEFRTCGLLWRKYKQRTWRQIPWRNKSNYSLSPFTVINTES